MEQLPKSLFTHFQCRRKCSWVKNTRPTTSIYNHCVKSVCIRSFSGSYFPAFGLNTDRYGVSLHIQSKCRKIRTRITSNTDTFYAVTKFNIDLRRRGVRDIIKVSHEIISTLVLCFADKNRVLHENWKPHVCLFCLFFIWSRSVTDREKVGEHPL